MFSPEKKGEEAAESTEALEADVQGNVQIKMVVSNGKVRKIWLKKYNSASGNFNIWNIQVYRIKIYGIFSSFC